MALPSTIVYASGDYNYIAELNQHVSDLNSLYTFVLSNTAVGGFVGTSVTSNLVGTGSKTFALAEATARGWTVGMTLHVANTAAPANYMEGQVTAYTHPSVTINVTATGGAGTLAAWSLGLASPGSVITGMTPGALTANQFVVVNASASAITGITLPRTSLEDMDYWMGV